ncbi:type II toxin-antitoxin system HicA family toxin [Pseudorhodoferax sp. Leaf274]|uniref:type II toxin-antitoxin system HicA family toxin n=1 Tax=Pseudorhodoferax sp. Leaf274 TaxID=1736318 RepID=UPI0009EAD541|nr:type II toxin-antitoxin system HicA family toxin [Pseudorhodoferax sp. Leaf274]
MSRKDKLLARLRAAPKDFTWEEAVSLMGMHNFSELNATRGSGKKFVHTVTRVKVILHKPHPGNILKGYVVQALLDGLKNSGEID